MAGEGKFFDNLMVGDVEVTGTVVGLEEQAGSIVALTVASTLTEAQSGKLFTLGTAGGFTTTLPLPAAGLKYDFVVKVAPTTAYIILSSAVANIIEGGMATKADGAALVFAAASDTITFVANTSLIGDRVTLISDGTYWYATGYCATATGIVGSQAA